MQKKGHNGMRKFWIIWVIGMTISIALSVLLIWVVAHYAIKYW